MQYYFLPTILFQEPVKGLVSSEVVGIIHLIHKKSYEKRIIGKLTPAACELSVP
jgi:hypothetical protein